MTVDPTAVELYVRQELRMKRRKFIGWLAVILCACMVYVVYCLRSFYMAPKIFFDTYVEADARRAVEEWYAESEYAKPVSPTSYDIFYRLTHPYEGRVSFEVESWSEGQLMLQLPTTSVLIECDGEWHQDRIREVPHH
ncbi:MAG: hypothetical protein H7A51_13695 [Akkermansiaceae bacterium]|nr:hypothetical protein [Akkermansiaceae bacterium]